MEFGVNKKPRILLISSAYPCEGSGHLGLDFYNAFKKQGYEIDFLTEYKVQSEKDILYVFEKESFLKKYIFRIIRKLRKLITKNYPLPEYHFFYQNEHKPPVSSDLVANSINKQYDLVLILFWNNLLSVETIEKIYHKLKVPFFFIAVDYSPITGGCHYFGECTRYKNGCGCCPAWRSSDPNDLTHRNVLYRKKVYDEIEPIIWGNQCMNSFIQQSFLFKERGIETIFPMIDEQEFTIRDKMELRKIFNIPNTKKFVLFFGAQSIHDQRKGIRYLIEALDIFFDSLSISQRKDVLLIIAGESDNDLDTMIRFDYLELGFVDFTILPQIFSLADLHLSPSIQDAGPMMVNQSLSCGVPVVAFDIGTALEVINNKGTGYCAELKNSADFAKGIQLFYKMNSIQKAETSIKCRNMALATTSYALNVNKLVDKYYSIVKSY